MADADRRPAPPSRARSGGIDLARGIAVILMIQTHAYAGWANTAAKHSAGYHLTRILGAIPAPLFLFLAGVGLALGTKATSGAPRGDRFRLGLVRRGAEIVGYGYLVSLVYAAIEGSAELPALLRADILHCIGLSLIACALLLLGRSLILIRAILLSAAALLLGLLAHRLLSGHPLPLPLAVPAALLFDVAPFTRFPLLPLCGFTALGVAFGTLWQRSAQGRLLCLLFCAASILVSIGAYLATQYTLLALGGTLSRGHPAIVWNFLDGTARALAVLFASLAVMGQSARLRDHPALSWLLRLGRGSLLAYAFHIPFCFGRLAAPLAGRLGMGTASLAVLLLCALTYGIVYGRDRLRASWP